MRLVNDQHIARGIAIREIRVKAVKGSAEIAVTTARVQGVENNTDIGSATEVFDPYAQKRRVLVIDDGACTMVFKIDDACMHSGRQAVDECTCYKQQLHTRIPRDSPC